MTNDARELGRLEGEMTAVKEQMAEVKADLAELRDEVHIVGTQVAEMRAELRALLKQRSPHETLYAFAVFAAAGGGLYLGRIEAWMAGAGVVLGALVLQRASLSRVVTGWFNRGGNGDAGSRSSGSYSSG